MSQVRKIAVMIGTRPEAIKMAPLHLALRRDRHFAPVLVSTGQHREMLEQALAVFGLTPDVDMGLMRPGQNLGELSSALLASTHQVLKDLAPDAVLVQGDTTTVLMVSISAFYLRIPVGHVEAGLRTYDLDSPWPEEMNRRLTAPLCRWCFAPTKLAMQNLLREQVPPSRVYLTGNTVIDALF